MQVTETLSQGLKREFQVLFAAQELEDRLTSELSTLKDKAQIKGFRPGKVPPGHVRRLYGKGLMGEVVQQTIDESAKQALGEIRPAGEPNFDPSLLLSHLSAKLP